MNTSKAEKYRSYNHPLLRSKKGDQFGYFKIPIFKKSKLEHLNIICAPTDSEWQHVSVSLRNRTPTWSEMCKVKDLFWGEDVTVVQYHPKKSEYVNNHNYCLHLWKKRDEEIELPPSILTGIKGLSL